MSYKDWVQSGHQLFSWATVWKWDAEMGYRLDMGCRDKVPTSHEL